MTARENQHVNLLDLEVLVKENVTLKTWIRGVLEGCEGCTNQAKAWAQALDEMHEEK